MSLEEEQLRKVVAQQLTVCEDRDSSDESCRESCSVILEAIGTFLATRDGNCSSSIPLEFLRETTSWILREIGPGDTLFRTEWLRIVRHSQLQETLHFALEFLPLALLPLQDDQETNETILLVWKILESTIEQNNNSATAIFHCLNRLVVTNRIREKEAFSFFLHHLHVPDKDTAVKSLLNHATKAEDYALAIETFRRLARDDDDDDGPGLSFTSSVVNILFRLQREGNHSIFFEEYLAILDNETHKENHPGAVEPASVTTLDLVLLLFHREDNHEDHGPSIESMYDDMVSMGLIHSKILASLISVITDHLNDCWDDMIWFLLLLCSSPLRNPQHVPMTQPLVVAKEFGVGCFAKSDTEEKEQILVALLQFMEECLDSLTRPTTREEEQSSGNTAARPMYPLVMSNMLGILVPAAEMSPELFSKHHHTLLRLLQCQDLDRESVQAICKLLVMVDNHSKVKVNVDSMDPPANLFVLVRNLLFSDPFENTTSTREGDCSTELCARGLMLVSEMFASSVLEQEDIPLLWEFVRRVLLPPTHRLVNPRIESRVYGQCDPSMHGAPGKIEMLQFLYC